MKGFAALLILFSCTGIGILKTMDLFFDLKQIRQYQDFLFSLKTKILFGHIPLKEALISKEIDRGHNDSMDSFCNSFQDYVSQPKWDRLTQIWDKLSNDLIRNSELKAIWIGFGHQLGKGSLNLQEQAFSHCEFQLQRLENAALENLRIRGKMNISLGICCGLFLTVLIL